MTTPQEELATAIRLGEISAIDQLTKALSPSDINKKIKYAELLNEIIEDSTKTLCTIIQLMQQQLAIKLLEKLTDQQAVTDTKDISLAQQYSKIVFTRFLHEIDRNKSNQHQLDLLQVKSKRTWIEQATNNTSALHQAFSPSRFSPLWFYSSLFPASNPLIETLKMKLLTVNMEMQACK